MGGCVPLYHFFHVIQRSIFIGKFWKSVCEVTLTGVWTCFEVCLLFDLNLKLRFGTIEDGGSSVVLDLHIFSSVVDGNVELIVIERLSNDVLMLF